MQDGLGRQITYLRVSVTEDCNLRCLYCRPAKGGDSGDIRLGGVELFRAISAASRLGVRKIRFTGGEPLLRPDLTEIISQTRTLTGIEEITLTTNGILLGAQAAKLREAGLDRVNVSLDSLDPARYRRLTRGGNISEVQAGIEAALSVGLAPLKLNVVLVRGVNEDEIPRFADLTMDRPIQVRFLELMPFGMGAKMGERAVVSAPEILARLPGIESQPVPTGRANGPARIYRLPGAVGTVGIISPVSSCFCPMCNRLRLTSNGVLQPCLFSAGGIDIGSALRAGADEQELMRIIAGAAGEKPANWQNASRGNLDRCGRCALGRPERLMSQVGG